MDSANSKAGKTTPSSSPQVVVECPSCTTKFAVESAAIAAIEQPRFHCSRCDAVFSLASADVVTTSEPPKLQAVSQQQTPVDAPPTAEKEPGEIAPRAVAPTAETAAPASPEAPTLPQQLFEIPKAPLPRPAPSKTAAAPIRPSDFSLSSSIQEDGIKEEQLEETAVHGVAPQTTSGTSATTPETPEAVKGTTPTGDFKITDDAEAASTKAPTKRPNERWEPLSGQSPNQRPSANSFEHKNAPKPAQHRVRGSGESAIPGMKLRFPVSAFTGSRNQGLVVLSMPIFAVMCALIVVSYSVRLSPQGLGSLVGSVVPAVFGSAPRDLPPTGLTVRGVSLRLTRTQSSEVVPVVHGTLVNGTDREINGVTLEGLGFDSRGEVLLSSQAPLRSALSRERVDELSLQQVKKFQLSLNARKAAIAPGEEVAFTVALLGNHGAGDETSLADIDLSQLKYFSARVFSVQ